MTTTLTKNISEVYTAEIVVIQEYDDNDVLISKHADITISRIEKFGIPETRALVENADPARVSEVMMNRRIDDDDTIDLHWALDVFAN